MAWCPKCALSRAQDVGMKASRGCRCAGWLCVPQGLRVRKAHRVGTCLWGSDPRRPCAAAPEAPGCLSSQGDPGMP